MTKGVIDAIVFRNEGRIPALLARKFDTMRRGVYTFLRAEPGIGLAAHDLREMPATPLVHLCGDLHVENFGCFPGENGLVYFDVVDFDQTARGPLSIDLVRFLSAVLVAAAEAGYATADRRALAVHAVRALLAALARGKSFWIDKKLARGHVDDLIEAAASADEAAHLAERTEGRGAGLRIRRDGKRYLDPFDDVEARSAASMALVFAVSSGVRDPDVLDVAYRVAGKGSLGLPRYLVLLSSTDGPLLLDVKRAMPSLLVDLFPGAALDLDVDRARAVADAEERWQAVPPPFLGPTFVNGQPFLIRGHHPQDDAVRVKALAGLAKSVVVDLVKDLARVAAWGLLRGAGRAGAQGVDDLVAFARHTPPDGRVFVDAAVGVAAEIVRAHKAFAKAWPEEVRARDPRLVALTRGDGP